MIGGPTWTGVGLYALHSHPVRTSLGCCEGYMTGFHGGPHVSGGPFLTVSWTEFSHYLILMDYDKINQ